ncbi:DUF6009 family protein [Streptomyces mirabilis]|uniref:DUF6009 family protein n=1 Tax=Streptomyces mirabilis TaxID=68239 RepID=UPI0033D6042B
MPNPVQHNSGSQSLFIPQPRPEQGLSCTDKAGTEAVTLGQDRGQRPLVGPSRLQSHQLTDEIDIVWLIPVDELDYVREGFDITKRRTGRPAYHGHGRLVGYANLRPDAVPTRDSGRYNRRTFWLLSHDRGEAPDTEYRTHAPLEAVDPRTVGPGQPGYLTERAWGKPLPPRHEQPPQKN